MDKLNRYSFAGAIVLRIAYGYQAEDNDDPLVKLVDDAMEQFSEVTGTNAFAVDTFTFRGFFILQHGGRLNSFLVRFVPQWFPGAAWKKKAQQYHKALQAMLDTSYDWVKTQMVINSAFLSNVSDNGPGDG